MLNRQRMPQSLAGQRIGLKQLGIAAGKDDLAAFLAGQRADVNNVVGD